MWNLKEEEEEEEEDDDDYELSPDRPAQFPTPLSLLSAQQTLELILLLSKIDPSKNKTIFESISSTLDRSYGSSANLSECEADDTVPHPENFNSQKNSPQLEEPLSPPQDNQELSPQESQSNPPRKTPEISFPEVPVDSQEPKITVDKITDSICQDKLDELKVLLINARKAVTNIVSSHEKLNSTEQLQNIPNETEINHTEEKKISPALETSSSNSLEVWTTPNVSRSNSDSDCRAGKYNKKPAPKVPITKLDDEETASQNALKATLVIKTGTLKTFTNVSETKNVFVSHLPESSKSKKKKKSRKREGFSKLLTIPKTFFNHAFHKEQRDSTSKEEDANSSFSEASGSRSRSVSVGSREANCLESVGKKQSVDLEDVFKVALSDDDPKNLTYVDLRSESIDRCASDEATNDFEAFQNSPVEIPDRSLQELQEITKIGESVQPSLRIRQMSHSPTLNSRRSFHDNE